jgi:hypothetical protein
MLAQNVSIFEGRVTLIIENTGRTFVKLIHTCFDMIAMFIVLVCFRANNTRESQLFIQFSYDSVKFDFLREFVFTSWTRSILFNENALPTEKALTLIVSFALNGIPSN